MSDITADQFKDAARRAYEAGDVATARKLIQRAKNAAPQQPDRAQERGLLQTIGDNVIGFDDGVDSPGEKIGRTINDVVRSAETGARTGFSALADLPGAAFNYAGGKIADVIQGTGAVSPEVAAAAKDALQYGPMGSGSTVREGMNAVGLRTDREPETKAGQYARTVGEFLPAAVMPGGQLGAHAIAPGVMSEAAGQATEGMNFPDWVPGVGGGDVEPWARGAAAIAAPGVYNAGRRAITPNPADPARISAAKRLDAEGVKTTAGQKTGAPMTQLREGASSRARQVVDGQNEQFTTAALRRIQARDPETLGPAIRATPEVLKKAGDDIGQMFDEVAENVRIAPQKPIIDKLKRVESNYKLMTAKSNIAPIIKTTRKKIENAIASGEPISGSAYRQWRSQLSKALVGNDRQLADAAGDVIDVLDDAAEASLLRAGRGDVIKIHRDARRMWGDYKAIVDAASKSGDEAAVGIISPARLRMAVAKGSGKGRYATGEGDMGNLARDANAVIQKLPDPQQDQLIARMASEASMSGGAAGGLAYALTRDPTIAATVGGASMLAPSAASRAMGIPSVQRYLANQVATGSNPTVSPQVMGLLGALGVQGNEKERQR